jgi:iron complex transport system permease protein
MVPHMARRIFGPDHRVLIPMAALMGAILLVLADTLARSLVSPGELPVGVITAMLGAPFFCYLLIPNAFDPTHKGFSTWE